MDNVDLKQYLPIVYEGVVESETQQDSLSIEIDKMNNTYEQALMDQFVQFASLKVLPYYENIFNIVANPETESVQFRRERILSRMKMLTPPYTYYYLRTMLDEFFGKGRYKLDVDNNNFTILLESAVENSLWYHEIQVSITAVKPCNMIFINVPRVSKVLNINETIYAQKLIWNYKLDGRWSLGASPFYSVDVETIYNYRLNGDWKLGIEPFTRQQGEIVKMPNIKSLQQPLFDYTLEKYKPKFYKAKLNDTLEIVIQDSHKTISPDTIRLEYSVERSQIENITNIKLLDTEDNVLENANVYIPVPDTVQLVHTLKLQEEA